ncbi:MAG TPA: ABC transporter ATP-binding protein [Solirubrobacteraceae bacterium]|nr:ABC transporter ATP-binding protein [Solirubrobacteraceae bacterium]
MTGTAAIALDGVSKHYETPAGLVRAVDGITLEVPGGSSLAITGVSGCGKSTLLGLIGGLEAPSAGSVTIAGERISALTEQGRTRVRREQIGFVFQADNLQPFLTAVENVEFRLALAGSPDRDGRARELLAELGLDGHADKLPDQLSGGQRQRVAIARALIHRPRLILADEPTGSLDEDNSHSIVDLLLAARQSAAATLVVVTHDHDVAGRLGRTVCLRDGHLEHA